MSCQPNFKEGPFEKKASRGGGEKLRIQSPSRDPNIASLAVFLLYPAIMGHSEFIGIESHVTSPPARGIYASVDPAIVTLWGTVGRLGVRGLSRSERLLRFVTLIHLLFLNSTTTHSMTSADNVFIDSLPYYDDDLAQHPNLQALVDAEIARELKAKPPPNHATDPRLPPERPLFKVRHFAHSCFCLAIFCTITASVILHIHTRKPLPLRHKSIHPLALGFTFLGGSLRPYADLVFF